MFGYVKPIAAELLVKEHEFYRSVYCGICRTMKKHTGALSNVTLSYDSVFLALVRMLYVDDSEVSTKPGRCIAHPLKKRQMLTENAALEYTARVFAILTYYKLCDDLRDEKLYFRAAASVARPVMRSADRRAAIPELSSLIAEKLGAINALEDQRCESVDLPASVFGELLGEVFAHGFEGDDRLVLYQCGYHLGRFIYAADAAEDYDKDVASGAYNPYAISYGGAPLTDENRASIKCALLLECKKLESAVNLLPFGNRATIENIINNTIYLGLPKRIEFLDASRDLRRK